MTQTTPSARKGVKNRVQLSQRPRVDRSINAQLNSWMKGGVSLSDLIGRLVTHAKRTKFNPADDCL